jgi:hypothetical protein
LARPHSTEAVRGCPQFYGDRSADCDTIKTSYLRKDGLHGYWRRKTTPANAQYALLGHLRRVPPPKLVLEPIARHGVTELELPR